MGATAGITAQAAGAGAKAYAAYQGSQATKSALEAQSTVAAQNAQVAEWQAQDALERGGRAEQQVRQRGAQLKSTQRARLAANGITLDSGSALDVLSSTDYTTSVDAATTHDNAGREAWAYRVGAANKANDARLLSARAGAISPGSAAITSLIGDAGPVAKSWYRYSSATNGAKSADGLPFGSV